MISDPRNQVFYDAKIELILCGRMLRIIEMAVLKRGLSNRKVLFLLATNKWKHWKPLDFAAARGRTRFAEWLIDTAGLDLSTINGTGREPEMAPLFHAVLGDHLKMVDFLLDRNADPNQKSKSGKQRAARGWQNASFLRGR